MTSAIAFCRLDEHLIAQIQQRKDVRPVLFSAARTIVIGAASYGLAFGIWRGPTQAVFSAIKLPVLLLAVAVCTIGLGAMLAMLLRSKLSLGQTGVCMLLSFAVTSAVLGALTPVSIALDVLVPRTTATGRALLLFHTAMIAAAGVAGVLRLRTLLARLGLEHVVARRVLVSWISAQFLVGSQLSWLLRPFFGDLHARPTFLAHDVLRGSFFAAVDQAMRVTFGAAAPFVYWTVGIGFVITLVSALRADPNDVTVEIGGAGLAVQGAVARFVSFHDIANVRCADASLVIELAADETLAREALRVRCASREAATSLAQRISDALARVGAGPFRTPGSSA
ncbi:MAG TPA: hypothetical protein VGH87_02935 [Polyangiaceae bacterium]